MAIEQTTPQAEIDAYLEEQLNRRMQATVRTMQYVGEACLNAARSSKAYKDQTGNLRSSVGYVVSVDGKIVEESSFAVVAKGGAGAKDGAEYAKKLARQYPKGITLIMVAGMDYAAYVSATGRDVLDSAELLAQSLVPKMLKQLGIK